MNAVIEHGSVRLVYSDAGGWRMWLDGKPSAGLFADRDVTTFFHESLLDMVEWNVCGFECQDANGLNLVTQDDGVSILYREDDGAPYTAEPTISIMVPWTSVAQIASAIAQVYADIIAERKPEGHDDA